MEDLYNDFLVKKLVGKLPSWKSISELQMRRLYLNKNIVDKDVAALFEVSLDKVRYKRKTYGLSHKKINILRFFNDQENDELQKLNQASKERLFSYENFDRLSIGLAHYCFRNGPVEDIHANGQLSENDMKALNKYLVDHIAKALLLGKEGRWLELELLLNFHMQFGSTWDKPDTSIDELYNVITDAFILTE